MPRVLSQKSTKPAIGSSKVVWDRPAIIAALSRKGWSLRRLSLANGYSAKSGLVLREPWRRAEEIIAAAIGVPAEEIWPDRYRSRAAFARRRRTHKLLKPAGLNGEA